MRSFGSFPVLRIQKCPCLCLCSSTQGDPTVGCLSVSSVPSPLRRASPHLLLAVDSASWDKTGLLVHISQHQTRDSSRSSQPFAPPGFAVIMVVMCTSIGLSCWQRHAQSFAYAVWSWITGSFAVSSQGVRCDPRGVRAYCRLLNGGGRRILGRPLSGRCEERPGGKETEVGRVLWARSRGETSEF